MIGKVSIIVPVYNVEKYVSYCLDSILAQTYTNWECICVDDGSTDGSGMIIDGYTDKDMRIKVIHKKNEGVSTARNTGLIQATGDFICFADSDDCLMPDYMEYMLNLIIHNNCDIALTSDVFTSNEKRQKSDEKIKIITGEQCTSEILLHRIPIGVYSKLFRREIINDIKFFPDIFIGEGFNFNTIAFQKAKKIILSNRKIYFYRTDNPNSAVSLFKLEKWENALKALDRIEDNLVIKTPLINNSMNYARWYDYVYILRKIVKNKSCAKYPEFVAECKKGIRFYSKYVFKLNVSIFIKCKCIVLFFFPMAIIKMLCTIKK